MTYKSVIVALIATCILLYLPSSVEIYNKYIWFFLSILVQTDCELLVFCLLSNIHLRKVATKK